LPFPAGRQLRGLGQTAFVVRQRQEQGRFSIEEMTELKWITVPRGQRAFPI
jgi:hypothetical protein